MKILFHLGHPAHFHLFKNVIDALIKKKHKVYIIIKTKDHLELLIEGANYQFKNILPIGRKNNLIGILKGMLTQDIRLLKYCHKKKPDLLIGTSVSISHVGKLLNIPSINVNEDDASAVKFYAYSSYPLSTSIISPVSCNNNHWCEKTIKYNGYHELAYLHPNYFTPSKKIVGKYLPTDKPYFLVRFAKLTAHHDKGKTGINTKIASKIIKLLIPHGDVHITSERELEPEFEKFRLDIDPLDVHHIMAFAKLYIGDSQTMAAEAAVLGTPSIRFNDFVGKLGYLEELEHKYGLTYGIRTSKPEKLYSMINALLKQRDIKKEWQAKKDRMINEKIDVTAFFVWFIENYPNSQQIMKENLNFQNRFK